MIAAGAQPPGSTTEGATRAHTWIGMNTSRISVVLAEDVCTDDESGIHGVELWLGSRRNGVGDLIATQIVQPGGLHMLNLSRLFASSLGEVDSTPMALSDRDECQRSEVVLAS